MIARSTVFFPFNGPEKPGAVHCVPLEKHRPGDAMVQVNDTGRKVERKITEAIPGVLLAARSGGSGDPLMVVFNTDGRFFEENSYQLALAISERLFSARRDNSITTERRIFATGELRGGSDGVIDLVGGFPKKLNAVLDHIDPGDVFVFPAANRVTCDEDCEGFLDQLRQQRVLVVAAAQIDELRFLWPAAPEDSPLAAVESTGSQIVNRSASKTYRAYHYLLSFLIGAGLTAICAFMTLML